MGTYKPDLVVKAVDATHWQLMDDFYFEGLVVPKGFITDFASIPQFLWSILPPTGSYTKAAVLHDYLYKNGYSIGFNRKSCDDMFLSAMQDLNVGFFTRKTLYYGVRMFGVPYFIEK